MQFLLGTEDVDEEHMPHALFTELDEICLREGEDAEWKETARYGGVPSLWSEPPELPHFGKRVKSKKMRKNPHRINVSMVCVRIRTPKTSFGAFVSSIFLMR